MTAAVEAL
jgi:hypothetical protein